MSLRPVPKAIGKARGRAATWSEPATTPRFPRPGGRKGGGFRVKPRINRGPLGIRWGS